MSSGPRGVGTGLKLLIGAAALAYGVKEATYTGPRCFFTSLILKDNSSVSLNNNSKLR